MIVYNDKSYEMRSDKPNENWLKDYPDLPQPIYVVPDESDIAKKIADSFPYYDFVVQEGELVDIMPLEKPEPEPELPTLESLKEENKLLKQQVQALSDQNEFHEELIVELANVVYA